MERLPSRWIPSQPPFSPPWEDWELDAAFLAALSDWEAKNRETTLQRVFQSASLAIDQGKDLVEVIPDHPFPAKGLVKAVLVLVKLGASISGAQPELVVFAKDIIEWVDGVKISFANAGSGNVTETTWENLTRMRDLINEICMWAVLRLGDGRWSLKNARIDKEITDFKARLDHAQKVFQNRSIIVISGGLDAILQKLRALLKSFDRISRTLKDIRSTQKEHHKVILEELRNQQGAHDRQKFLQTSLYPRTAVNVEYDQQERIPCDEDTRVEVLADIRAWVNDISYGSKNFMWLTGDPGCGKSAVTASVARECKDRRILWAQFFINRNNDDTTNPNLYFPTIARQLAENSSVVELKVFNTLRQKLSLLDGITREQATRLFIDTLEAAASIDTKVPVVVVIDGLDETRQNKLEETANIISTLFDALENYPNVKVFISSRTEDGIQRPFSGAMRDRRVENIHLDTNSESSMRDVELFLRKRFTWIADKYGYNQNIWPGEGRLQVLASHASGHFIWAVTVTKFLEEQMDEWGLERLDMVMENLGTTEGKQGIKALYGVILHLTYQKSRDPWAFETFRRVVGAIAASLEPLSITQLEVLLDLRKDFHSSSVDLLHLVRRLRTLLVAGTDDITGDTILRLHKSFFEYITSKDCEDHFRVWLEVSNTELAFQCLRQITQAYWTIRNARYSVDSVMVRFPNSSQLRYSLRFCMSHFPKKGEKSLRVVLDELDVKPLPVHLNALPYSFRGVDEGCGSFTLHYLTDTDRVLTSFDGHDLCWAAKNGCLLPRSRAKSRAILRCSAISPLGTTIAVGFTYKSGRHSLFQSEVEVLNTVNLLPLCSIPLMNPVKSLAFWPDGKYIAVHTGGSIIKIDIETGNVHFITSIGVHSRPTLIFTPDGCLHKIEPIPHLWSSVLVRSSIGIGSSKERVEMPHEAQFKFMEVSYDRSRILTISQNRVYIWDFQGGHMIQSFSAGFSVWVATISPDNGIVICSDDFGVVYKWDIKNSQSWRRLGEIGVNSSPIGDYSSTRYSEAGSWLFSSLNHLVFSPDGNFIAGASHGAPLLWDWRLKKCFIFSRYPKSQSYQCPIFSSNEEYVLFFGKNGVMKHFLSPNRLETAPPQVEWTLFSPDGNFGIYAVSKGGLCLCDLKTRKTDRLPFPEDEDGVEIICAAFSNDASRIAGISNHGNVYMWETAQHGLLGTSTQPRPDATSISFAVDGETIILSSEVKAVAHLSLENGSLLNLSDGKYSLPARRTLAYVHYFDWADTAANIYSPETAPNSRLENVRWFPDPSDESDVIWAFVDNHIVRGGADGTFVVVPVDAGKERLEGRQRAK